jgi:hypothetical protein
VAYIVVDGKKIMKKISLITDFEEDFHKLIHWIVDEKERNNYCHGKIHINF